VKVVFGKSTLPSMVISAGGRSGESRIGNGLKPNPEGGREHESRMNSFREREGEVEG